MNRLRVALLSLLVLALIAGALPVTDSLAKWSRRSAVSQYRRHRRHTRAWWRRHRALARARRERAAQRRQGRELRLAGSSPDGSSAAAQRYANAPTSVNVSLLTFDAPPALAASTAAPSTFAGGGSPNTAANINITAVAAVRRSQMPFDFNVPSNWSPSKRARQGEAVYNVLSPDGRTAGTAVLAPVSLSTAQVAGAPTSPKTKTVGGLSVTALRRTVIDRMVAEGGWVTNDIIEESHGRRVFIVLAQTGAPGAPARSWTFYFTEIDGRVYSLATTAPVEFSAPLAAGSEQLMATLRAVSSKNVASER
ncbi:MAG: hypothetical protein ACJ74Q_11090 [Pyrinomonadaceae bacterium]